jgi:MFS transporter, DHA1 family, multidrug resistance protein
VEFCSADNVTIHSAASAIAANTFLRSFVAAGFPLFSRQMFNNLKIQWAGTLLGCLATAMVPIPVCFYLFGKKLRARSKFNPTMMLKPPPVDDSTEDEGDIVAAPPEVANGAEPGEGRSVEKVGNNQEMKA